MTSEQPSTVRLDVNSADLPPGLADFVEGISGSAGPLVLGATPGARERGWAARAAVTLATVWSDEGRSVALVDAGILDPSLHDALGEMNDDGVVDHFLYGASADRVSVRALGDAFTFVAAGTYPPDPAEILEDGGWGEFLASLAGVELPVVYLPVDVPGAEALLERGAGIVLLSLEGEEVGDPFAAAVEERGLRIVPEPEEEAGAVAGEPGEADAHAYEEEPGEAGEEETAEEPGDADAFAFQEEIEGAGPEGPAAGDEEADELGLDAGFGFGEGDEPGAGEGADEVDAVEGLESFGFAGEPGEEEAGEAAGEEEAFAWDEGGMGFGDEEEAGEPGAGEEAEAEAEEAAGFEWGEDELGLEEEEEEPVAAEEEEPGDAEEEESAAPEEEIEEVGLPGRDAMVREEEPEGAAAFEPGGADEEGVAGEESALEAARDVVEEEGGPPGEEEPVPAGDEERRAAEPMVAGGGKPPERERKPAKKPRKGKKKSRSRLLPVLLVVLVVAGGYAGWEYLGDGADLGAFLPFLGGGEPAAEAPPAGGGGAAAPTPVPTRLRWGVALDSYSDLATARERVDRLASVERGLNFYIAPISDGDQRFFRLLAGPFPDTTRAIAVGDGLGDRELGSDPGGWILRETGLAFDLGTYDAQHRARARVEELAAEGVPAYLLPIPYSDGSRRYRVYAGGYSGSEEAATMRRILQGAGIEAELVQIEGAGTE